MDFFQRQDQARKNTKWLVVYFALAVAGIVLSVYLAGLLAFAGIAAKAHRYGYEAQFALWNPTLFAGVALGTLAVIGLGSAYKISALSGGGGAVAESLGGRFVDSATTDRDERKLLNVVEEMSIASGVPMPQVFVMDAEAGINAFAAGHTPSDAAVAVSRGCLQRLTRDELQGVIGHEFSHILNGDMKLNLRLMGVIFGIVSLVTIGRILTNVRGGSRENRNALPLFGLVLILVGAVGAFFANLIQAAVSRQREFLADASSVQFTRNPSGLSGALQKIGSAGSQLESEHAHEASHMFFANGLGEKFFHAFDTHPPLDERIRAIDPQWDGSFKPLSPLPETGVPQQKKSPPPILGAQQMAGLAAAAVLPTLGQPTPLHLKYAEDFHAAIPDDIRLAAREPLGAAALIFALLLDEKDSLRAQQLAELTRRFPAAQPKTAALAPSVARIAPAAKLPLVSLVLPALRQLSDAEYKTFSDTLQWLIESDGEVDLFEFTLQKILSRHLATQFGEVRRGVVQFYSIKPLVPDCAVLLSALAHVGSDDAAAQQKAFVVGVPFLRAPEEPVFLALENCGLEKIDAALDRLTQVAPQIKKNLLEACAHVAGADGVIVGREAELLRAIADTLDCPLPPFLPAE